MFSLAHIKWLTLTKVVFFIYALHGLYIVSWYCGGLFNEYFADSSVALRLLVYFAVPAFKISACLVIFVFMERFTPKIPTWLTGNRS